MELMLNAFLIWEITLEQKSCSFKMAANESQTEAGVDSRETSASVPAEESDRWGKKR